MCSSGIREENTQTPRVARDSPEILEARQTLAKSNPFASSDFELKLFSSLANESKENVVVSPFSAYAALCMPLNGAVGKTREQMAGVLGVADDNIEQLNARNQAVFAMLNSNDNIQMEIANGIYVDDSISFKKPFMELCHKTYDAEARSADYKNPSTINAINAWCDVKTHGRINHILDNFEPYEKIVLVNAIYFKGTWEHKFSESRSEDDTFRSSSDERFPIKMMHQSQHYPYYKGENFASVELAYAGGNQSMFIFLPDEEVDITYFQTEFTSGNWKSWMDSYHTDNVNLSLPRFEIKYLAELKHVLSVAGMSDAFSKENADFSQMIEKPELYCCWISRVLQETNMDVKEEGTEAAAVTVTHGKVAKAAGPRAIQFRVDRPFVVAIVDKESKEILFLGKIVKP